MNFSGGDVNEYDGPASMLFVGGHGIRNRNCSAVVHMTYTNYTN
jgi:hypothetical protein